MTAIVVLIRFKGEPEDLLARFEQARRLWVDEQEGSYEHPAFFATGRADDGILVIAGWETASGHSAFGKGIGPHLQAVEMPGPDQIEHVRIERLGW
jgi:hypothetical protein